MLVTPLYQGNKDEILPKMWQIHLIWVPNLKNVTSSDIKGGYADFNMHIFSLLID